mgnify:CR=1 FL=1
MDQLQFLDRMKVQLKLATPLEVDISTAIELDSSLLEEPNGNFTMLMPNDSFPLVELDDNFPIMAQTFALMALKAYLH